jgi:membrane carboxypeptidase/penicillin-binding protein
LRVFAGIALSLIALAVVTLAGVAGWFFLYTADLPDTRGLSAFAPSDSRTITTSICGAPVQILAVPGRDIGMMREAVLAAEGDFDPRGTFGRYYDDASATPESHKYGTYSWQLAREMFCESPDKHLKRTFAEMRTAHQLERHFSQDQLLEIYLNRAYFGNETYGVELAAEHYYGKQAKDLTIVESAMLAGLLDSPSHFSPSVHPDLALARRNEVIDAMARRGSITQEQAALAKLPPRPTDKVVPPADPAPK